MSKITNQDNDKLPILELTNNSGTHKDATAQYRVLPANGITSNNAPEDNGMMNQSTQDELTQAFQSVVRDNTYLTYEDSVNLAQALEQDLSLRDSLLVWLIDPIAYESDTNGDTTPAHSHAAHNTTAPKYQGVVFLKHPIILQHVEHGNNDFQRVLHGANVLLHAITSTQGEDGEFHFSDHPQALAGVAYLLWFVGASGMALMYASAAAVMGGAYEIHGDLLPRTVAMLVHNRVRPSHDNSIEADLSMLEGFEPLLRDNSIPARMAND